MPPAPTPRPRPYRGDDRRTRLGGFSPVRREPEGALVAINWWMARAAKVGYFPGRWASAPPALDPAPSGSTLQPPLVVLPWSDDGLEAQIRNFISLGAAVLVVHEEAAPGWLAPGVAGASIIADDPIGFAVDERARCARWNGRKIQLTGLELRLLAALATELDAAVSFADLRVAGWGEGVMLPADRHMVRSAIQRIRRKLRDAGAAVAIEPVRGFGFRLTR